MIFSSKKSNTATHRKLSFLISRTTSITKPKPQVASNWSILLKKEDDKHYSPEHNVCPIPPSFDAITANLWTTTNWQPTLSRICEQQPTWESPRNWFWGETTLPVTCNPVSTVIFFLEDSLVQLGDMKSLESHIKVFTPLAHGYIQIHVCLGSRGRKHFVVSLPYPWSGMLWMGFGFTN